MKKMFMAVTLILIILTAYGCHKFAAGTDGDTKAMGRYMEEACSLPDDKFTGEKGCMPSSITLQNDGHLKMSVADGNRTFFYESSDKGNTWESMEAVTEKYAEYNNDVLLTFSAPVWSVDGSLIFEKYEAVSDKQIILTYIQMDTEGNTKELHLDLPQMDDSGAYGFTWFNGERLKGNYLSSLQIDNEGYLYGIDAMHQLLKFDISTGKLLKNYDLGGASIERYMVVGDILIVYDGSRHLWYAKDSGKSFGEQSLLRSKLLDGDNPEDYEYVNFCAGEKENELFLYVDGCIYRYTMDGNIVELVVDGSFNSLSDPRMQLYWFTFDRNGGFMALCMNDVKFQLSRFVYDAEVPTMPDKELSIYALENSDYISQVVALYRKNHPDIYVTLDIGKSNEVTDTDEALKKLSEQLKSGSGPDVLLLDGVDCGAYNVDEYLSDISTLVREAGQDQLVGNIIQLNDEPLYTVPTRFSFYVCMGNTSAVENGGSLEMLADFATNVKGGDTYSLSPITYEELLKEYFDIFAAKLWNEDGQVDAAALKIFLRAYNDIVISQKLVKENPDARNDGIVSLGYVPEYYYYSDSTMSDAIVEVLEGENRFNYCKVSSMVAFTYIWSMKMVAENFDYKILPVYIPEGNMGINRNSSRIKAAEDFVAEMLTVDAQTLRTGGFPVSIPAFEVIVKEPARFENNNYSIAANIGDMSVNYGITWPSIAVREALIETAKNLSQPVPGSEPLPPDKGRVSFVAKQKLWDSMKQSLADMRRKTFDAEQCALDIIARMDQTLADDNSQ